MLRARIVVLQGPATGHELEVVGPQALVVGRARDASFCVPEDSALSRQHVQVEVGAVAVRVRDLESRHGTFVNGVRQTQAVLASGDHIQVGETVFRVEITSAAPIDHTLATDVPDAAEGAPRAAPLPDGYAPIRMLGQGAMGCVYLARHGDELRAVKQILPRAAMSPEMRARFTREAAVQASLVHRNIVRVYELIASGGCFSLVMEHVDGVGADARLQREGPFSPADVIELGCQALDALSYAHARNIVHRDIKESNLLLAPAADRWVVKVADFGLAKNFVESGASGLTGDGAIGGTLPYMPREQLLDFRYVTPAADIHALGATLYRLLTGQFPRDFRGGDNWVRVVLEEPIVPIAKRLAGAPPQLCRIIERALDPVSDRRVASAAEMRAHLAALSS